MDPNLKIVIDKLDGLTKRLDDREMHWERRFNGLERSLSARDEHVDRRLAELESRGSAPISPDIIKRIATLESACVNNEAAISKRLEAIESNRMCISDDDCDARVTALETVAADVNAWRPKLEGIVDDLRLKVQKVSMPYDRTVFDTSSEQPGLMVLPAPAAAHSSADTASSPNGHHVIQITLMAQPIV